MLRTETGVGFLQMEDMMKKKNNQLLQAMLQDLQEMKHKKRNNRKSKKKVQTELQMISKTTY